jgi:hypothetical protein
MPRTPRRTSRPLPRKSPIAHRTPSRKVKENAVQNKYRPWSDDERKKLVLWILKNLEEWNGKGTQAGKLRRCIREIDFDMDVDENSIKYCLNYLKKSYIATKKKWYETTGAGLPEDSEFDTIEGHNSLYNC